MKEYAKRDKVKSITMVVGTHGNQGFGYVDVIYRSGRVVSGKPRKLPIDLPKWTNACLTEPPFHTAYGLTYVYRRNG